MKTPSFWYSHPHNIKAILIAGILIPFSYVFQLATFLRRIYAKPYHSKIPIICIGNIVAGGAGKTPTALALAYILKQKGHRPVFVARGHGGKGKVTYVDPVQHSADEVGDEALLLAAVAPTWVGRDRVAAVRQAEMHGSVIIMDDGLQNPHLIPTASLLVIDGEVGIGNGRIIPAGPLREPLNVALQRVAAVVMVGERDPHALAAQITVPVLRARLCPRLTPDFPRSGRFVAFAGIARPEKFYATARTLGLDVIVVCDFSDHHPYDETDINNLRLKAEEYGARLLTTEKDAVRLPADFRAEVIVLPVDLIFDVSDIATQLAQLVRT